MDGRDEIETAVALTYGVVWKMSEEDLAAGKVPPRRVALVEASDFPFSFIDTTDGNDWEAWSAALEPTDPRVASLREVQALFSARDHVAPYNTRPNNGWEVIASVALAARTLDFRTNALFDVRDIQRRVREAFVHDRMIERTIYAIYGAGVRGDTRVGDRAVIVPATLERKNYLANHKDMSDPLIDGHCYLVVERSVQYADIREAKLDALPSRLTAALRAVGTSDLVAVGPWSESMIVVPSRFAGFRTFTRRPRRPDSSWYPGPGVDMTQKKADETAALDTLLNQPVAKELKNTVRSLQLALNRLTAASARNEASDAFLDLMIALEALLTSEGEKTEVAYRIGLRGAIAANTNTLEERTAIRKMLSTAYNTRSDIVHGSKNDLQISPSSTKLLRDFVATTIRMAAASISNGAPLVAAIESALLGDDARLRAVKALLD